MVEHRASFHLYLANQDGSSNIIKGKVGEGLVVSPGESMKLKSPQIKVGQLGEMRLLIRSVCRENLSAPVGK